MRYITAQRKPFVTIVLLVWHTLHLGSSCGIITTARLVLPYPCSSQAKTGDGSSLRGSNVLVCYK